MIPMTTWKKPRLYKKDKWKQKAENMTKEEWEEENRNKYLTTWTSPNGNTSRQIDYIMINAKQRNIVRRAQNNIYWRGNMNQNQQHRVQTMQLYYSAAKKYKKPIPTETGTQIKYDLKELREYPEKLTEAYRKYIEQKEEEMEKEHDWRGWKEYNQILRKLLVQTYPLKEKQTKAIEPNWILLMEKWGTGEEKRKFEYDNKKRDALRKEITTRNNDLKKQDKKRQQREILCAWRDEKQYIQENRKEIIFDNKPIIGLERWSRNQKKPKRSP